MLYPMKLGIGKPILSMFGANAKSCHVELNGGDIQVRFGNFLETFRLADIETIQTSKWDQGIGWRIGSGGCLGLIGALGGIVEIRLRAPRNVFVSPGIPYTYHRLFFALQDPDTFISDVRVRLYAQAHRVHRSQPGDLPGYF